MGPRARSVTGAKAKPGCSQGSMVRYGNSACSWKTFQVNAPGVPGFGHLCTWHSPPALGGPREQCTDCPTHRRPQTNQTSKNSPLPQLWVPQVCGGQHLVKRLAFYCVVSIWHQGPTPHPAAQSHGHTPPTLCNCYPEAKGAWRHITYGISC